MKTQKTTTGAGTAAAQFATRATHHIRADLKKAGLKMPTSDWITWRLWLQDLNLRSVLLKLRREGCMVAGFMHIKTPKKNSPFQ